MKLFYFVMFFLFNGFVSAVSSANENEDCSFHLHLLLVGLNVCNCFFLLILIWYLMSDSDILFNLLEKGE